MHVAIHKIEYDDSVAGTGETLAEVYLEGRWWVESVSLQNPNVAGIGEEGLVLVQFGNRGVFEAARPWHPLEIGLTREGAPMLCRVGQVMVWPTFVGRVNHVDSVSHRLTVLGYKMGVR